MLTQSALLNSSISTCTFATDGTGDITVGATHGLSAGQLVRFTTTGALPTEINVNGQYFVLAVGLTTTKLRISLTAGGSTITFAGAGTGTHTIWKSTLTGDFDGRGIQPETFRTFHTPQLLIGSGLPNPLATSVGTCTFLGPTITCSATHGLAAGNLVRFSPVSSTTTGVLPAPLSADSQYYVLASGLTATAFQISATLNGSRIDFGAQADIYLRVGAVQPKDVQLYAAPPVTLYKSSANAVLYDDNGFGWLGAFQTVWGWAQQLFCTAVESLSTADVPKVPLRVSATESLSTSDTIRSSFVFLTAAEALSTADVPTRSQNLVRANIEATSGFAITDTPVATLPKMRTVAELLSISDSPFQHIGPGVSATEALSCVVAASRLLVLFRHDSESLSVTTVAAPAHLVARLSSEALTISDLARRSAGFRRRVILTIATAELATSNVGGSVHNLIAAESLSTADAASRILHALRGSSESLLTSDAAYAHTATSARFATESLVISDSVSRVRGASGIASESLSIAMSLSVSGIWQRFPVESLLIVDSPARLLALLRQVVELLKLADQIGKGAGYRAFAAEALAIYQYLAWTTGPHDPWEYWLDLRTGNLPVESTLDVPDAESIASAPEAESDLGAPDAEAELVGSTADSGLRYIDP